MSNEKEAMVRANRSAEVKSVPNHINRLIFTQLPCFVLNEGHDLMARRYLIDGSRTFSAYAGYKRGCRVSCLDCFSERTARTRTRGARLSDKLLDVAFRTFTYGSRASGGSGRR